MMEKKRVGANMAENHSSYCIETLCRGKNSPPHLCENMMTEEDMTNAIIAVKDRIKETSGDDEERMPEPDPELSLAEFLSMCGLSQFFDAFEKDGVTLEILKKLSTKEGRFVAEMTAHGLGMGHRDALDDGLKSLASKRNADQVGASPGGESAAPNPKRAHPTRLQTRHKKGKTGEHQAKAKGQKVNLDTKLKALQHSIEHGSSGDDWGKLIRDAQDGKRPLVTKQHLQHLRKIFDLYEVSKRMKEGFYTRLCPNAMVAPVVPREMVGFERIRQFYDPVPVNVESPNVAVWNTKSDCLQFERANVIEPQLSTFQSLHRVSPIDGVVIFDFHDLPKTIERLSDPEFRVLKILDLRECTLVSLPTLVSIPDSIGDLKSLTQLRLRCNKLTERIGDLTSLTKLDLCQCFYLVSLPERIGDLKSLTKLDLFNCKKLVSLPDRFGECKSLTSLNLKYCTSLVSLPDSIRDLKALETLDLEWCTELVSLPERFGQLKSLTELNLSHCKNLTSLPERIGDLTSLTELDLRMCSKLVSLPDSIGGLESLTHLNLSDEYDEMALESLPDSIGDLTSLTELDLRGCENLTSLPERIGDLTSLTELNLRGCKNLTSLPERIGDLTSLTELNLRGCENLTSLPERIGDLKSLFKLGLSSCIKLVSLPERIGDLTSLTELDLSWCESLKSLPDRFGKSLKLLSMYDCLDIIPAAMTAQLEAQGCYIQPTTHMFDESEHTWIGPAITDTECKHRVQTHGAATRGDGPSRNVARCTA